jgi:flagellar biosynthetic protein FliR
MGADLAGQAFAALLVFARTGAAVAVLPALGEAAAPAMLKVGLTLALTALLTPLIAPLTPAAPEPGLPAAFMVGAEVTTGLALGWMARVVVISLPIAGQFIAYQLGISSVLQADPELGPQSSVLARLFEVAVPAALLASGLYRLPVAALAGSFRIIAPGTFLPAADSADTAIRLAAEAFALGVQLAAPFVLAGILWHVGSGWIARMVPRLQIYFASIPGQIAGGLALLAILSGSMMAVWAGAVQRALSSLPGLG